jgi:hypothetical protein
VVGTKTSLLKNTSAMIFLKCVRAILIIAAMIVLAASDVRAEDAPSPNSPPLSERGPNYPSKQRGPAYPATHEDEQSVPPVRVLVLPAPQLREYTRRARPYGRFYHMGR